MKGSFLKREWLESTHAVRSAIVQRPVLWFQRDSQMRSMRIPRWSSKKRQSFNQMNLENALLNLEPEALLNWEAYAAFWTLNQPTWHGCCSPINSFMEDPQSKRCLNLKRMQGANEPCAILFLWYSSDTVKLIDRRQLAWGQKKRAKLWMDLEIILKRRRQRLLGPCSQVVIKRMGVMMSVRQLHC